MDSLCKIKYNTQTTIVKRSDTMSWELKNDRPIYTQLLEHIQIDIISGRYHPGDKLPSVRDLAEEAAVNPNTMQKALQELERIGLVYTQRTSGRFITEDKEIMNHLKQSIAESQIQNFFTKMIQLGFTREEIITLVQNSNYHLTANKEA